MTAGTATAPAPRWRIRMPTAQSKRTGGAPAFTLDRPLDGVRVGLRHEGSWRSWMLIVDEWERYLRRDGAAPAIRQTGERVGDQGSATFAGVDVWVAQVDCGISGLGTCGSCTFPLADVNNDDPEDLAYTIAKCLAFPLNNWYLEPTGESGQLLLAVNPLWAERFARVFAEVESFQAYLWDHAWQPVELWRPANQEILRSKGRVDDQGRVRLTARPDQFVPVVCGGLGSLHAVALTSFCESQMQHVAVLADGLGQPAEAM